MTLVSLPGMDGVEVCRRIKAMPGLAAIPVLHTSAMRKDLSDRVVGLDAGADGYLVLPAERSELVSTVAALVRLGQANGAVRDEAARWDHCFGESLVAMAFVDVASGTITRANRAFAGIVGLDGAEVLGRRWSDAAGGRAVADLLDPARTLAPHGATYDDGHGGSVDVVEVATVRNGPDGDPSEVLLQLTDVTERRRLEVALAGARDQALAAGAAKADFISRMSHELRTPLNAVLGFAQLLELGELRADQREAVDHVLRAGRHLLDLVNEVLDLARIDAGRIEISVEPIDLWASVEEAVALMGPAAAQREIAIRLEPFDAPAYASADRQRLLQILLNLLSNAIKYNRHGAGVDVRVGGGTWSTVSVHDEGPGLEPDDLDRLFLPFDRLDAPPEVEGTGLGLALSSRLATAMGGRLTAESGPAGSTFTLCLPAAAAPVPETAGEGAVVAGRDPHPWSGVVRTVLYVEDNLANVALLEHVAATVPGLRLVTAMHGALALELAVQHQPDLVLLDVHLPDGSGIDVAARLRDEPGTAGIPVVMLSADGGETLRRRARRAGARAYLTKPFDLVALTGVLRGELPEEP